MARARAKQHKPLRQVIHKAQALKMDKPLRNLQDLRLGGALSKPQREVGVRAWDPPQATKHRARPQLRSCPQVLSTPSRRILGFSIGDQGFRGVGGLGSWAAGARSRSLNGVGGCTESCCPVGVAVGVRQSGILCVNVGSGSHP